MYNVQYLVCTCPGDGSSSSWSGHHTHHNEEQQISGREHDVSTCRTKYNTDTSSMRNQHLYRV